MKLSRLVVMTAIALGSAPLWAAEAVVTVYSADGLHDGDHSWYQTQFDAFTQIRNEPVAACSELHDIDHFPIAVLAGVEAVTLEVPIGLLLDAQAHAGSGLFECA